MSTTTPRTRRLLTVAAGAVAVLAVVLAVPAGRAILGGGSSPVTPRADGSGTATSEAADPWTPPAGWRAESWRDVQFAVPEDWVHGVLHQTGCSDDPVPAVERPGMASTLMWCPRIGYGVALGGPGSPPYADVVPFAEGDADRQTFPDGAVVERVEVGEVSLVVIAADGDTARRVADSARGIEGIDANACAAAVEVPVLGGLEVAGSGSGASDDRVSVCRYQIAQRGPNLVQSALLREGDSRRALDAVAAAPAGRGPDAPPSTCGGWDPEEAVLLRTPGRVVAWVHYDGCAGHGVDLGGRTAELTADVMRWALSAGWPPGVDGSVPLPDRPPPG